jgi:long-chain acyl-CoA synthetase
LPETEVRIAVDGEVLVRGPQVTRGYLGDIGQPFREDWLATGDLGQLTGAGALVIEGRKKELIKTSYGKYVRATRIEAMLRDLTGVEEALVVGEGRPFCAALLWVDGTHADDSSRAALDAAIVRMNRDLSHPEQVKHWAILTDELSVGSGDLTPNLKLRRPVVLRRFAREVDALYEEGPGSSDGIHVGAAPREGAIA